MLLEAERHLVARYGARMWREGLVTGTYGNISVCTGGRIAITPTDMRYGGMKPADVCVVDLAGTQMDGGARPSSELRMHVLLHGREGDGAIVHTHSHYATALGCVVDEIPALHYAVAEFGGPIPTVPYEPAGSADLAERVHAALADRAGVLLQSHGAVTIGASLRQAYARAVTLEWVARIYHHARMIGEPRRLEEARFAQLPRRSATP
ncbi:MAG: class II aldolase/adducin family protein [Thermoleophilaceae bacterium]